MLVDGLDIFALKDEALTIFRRRRIGFVFQSYNLVPMLSVYENIVLPIQLDGARVDEDYVRQVIGMLCHLVLLSYPLIIRRSGSQENAFFVNTYHPEIVGYQRFQGFPLSGEKGERGAGVARFPTHQEGGGNPRRRW